LCSIFKENEMKFKCLFPALASLALVVSCDKSPDPEPIENGRRTDFDVPALTADNTLTIVFDAEAGRPVDLLLQGGKIAVDWGDGSPMTKDIHPEEGGVEEYLRMRFDHIYKEAGEYTIKIWSEELTAIEELGYIPAHPASEAGFAELRVGNCPVLTTARFLSFSRTETLDFSRCPALDEVSVWQWPRLRAIDFDGCPLSQSVSLWDNPQLAKLDLSGNGQLTTLACHDNGLTELKLPEKIEYVNCWNNRLTSLDLKNRTALRLLFCSSNPELASLDLTGCGELASLGISNTALGAVDFGAFPKLGTIVCQGLGLASLDVTRNPLLVSLDCSGNALTALDLSKNPMLGEAALMDNRLDAEALNAIFTALPARSTTRLSMPPPAQALPTIRLVGNPGVGSCNPKIAADKGWRVLLD
jgi:hypothetical protein